MTARPGQRWRTETLAPCGTEAAARRHWRRKEPLDYACQVAARNAANQRAGWKTGGVLSPDLRPVRNSIPERAYQYRARRYPWAEQALARADTRVHIHDPWPDFAEPDCTNCLPPAPDEVRAGQRKAWRQARAAKAAATRNGRGRRKAAAVKAGMHRKRGDK